MTYGVPSVLSVSPWCMVFCLSCQCHHDVWCSVGLVSVTMMYGVPSVLSVSPWCMVFRRSCQCHHDVWCSVCLVGVTMRRSLRLHVIARSEATWQSFISGQKNKPHKNAEPTQKHKTLMIFCRAGRHQHFSIFSSGCKRSNLSTFFGAQR